MSDPSESVWFLSSEVQECVVAGRTTSTVWVNYRLLQAASLEEAYDRAVEFGKHAQTSYLDSDGETVAWKFRGLQDLAPLRFEDGVEVSFESHENQSEDQISRRIKSRQELFDSVAAEQKDREAQAQIDAELAEKAH
jgi:hypothetical protein